MRYILHIGNFGFVGILFKGEVGKHDTNVFKNQNIFKQSLRNESSEAESLKQQGHSFSAPTLYITLKVSYWAFISSPPLKCCLVPARNIRRRITGSEIQLSLVLRKRVSYLCFSFTSIPSGRIETKLLCAGQIVLPPSPPGHPRGHHFFVVAPGFLLP